MILPDLVQIARGADAEDVPAFLGRLAEAEAVLRLRLAAVVAPTAPQVADAERLLTPDQVVEALGGGVSRKWVLRHTKGLRFRRDLSRKVVLFEETGFRRWAAARR